MGRLGSSSTVCIYPLNCMVARIKSNNAGQQRRVAHARKTLSNNGSVGKRFRPIKQTSKVNKNSRRCVFVCAPGAGGGRSRQSILAEFGHICNFSFKGIPNLTKPHLEEPFLE